MGEPVKIVDLATHLIRLSNHTEDDIPIVYTGLRPGEKLFEEIRLEGESIFPTVHPQIVITEAPQPDPTVVSHWMHRAQNAGAAPEEVRMLMHELVAEYQRSTVDLPVPSAPLNAKAALA
jgi:FlaA1/EpsC-like NDP-sugar epimerase